MLQEQVRKEVSQGFLEFIMIFRIMLIAFILFNLWLIFDALTEQILITLGREHWLNLQIPLLGVSFSEGVVFVTFFIYFLDAFYYITMRFLFFISEIKRKKKNGGEG